MGSSFPSLWGPEIFWSMSSGWAGLLIFWSPKLRSYTYVCFYFCLRCLLWSNYRLITFYLASASPPPPSPPPEEKARRKETNVLLIGCCFLLAPYLCLWNMGKGTEEPASKKQGIRSLIPSENKAPTRTFSEHVLACIQQLIKPLAGNSVASKSKVPAHL